MLAFAVSACDAGGGPGAGSAGAKDSTPKDTVIAMRNGWAVRDRTAFLSVWKADPDRRYLLESQFDMFEQVYRLKSSIEKAYGADGWKPFHTWTKTDDRAYTPEQIAGIKVEQQGDRAIVTDPIDYTPYNVVKDGSRWLIEYDGAADLDEARMYDGMKVAFEKVIVQVGKPGQTSDSLHHLLDEEMMKVPPQKMPNR
jgi:hypothetical protein